MPISVIVPVYNSERFLAEAIQSVLNQTLPPDEIIVVNDGSTDGTATLIERLGARIRPIHQPNAGPAAARNTGLRAAQGNLVAFLDSDDWWPVDSLRLRAACLSQRPDLSGVVGATQLVLSTAFGPKTWGVPQPTLNLGVTLIRRAAFDLVGDFDEDFAYAEDADWLLRAREAGLRFGMQRAVVLMSRRHDANMTNQREPAGHYLAQALRQSLSRRRRRSAEGKEGRGVPTNLHDFVECGP